MNKISKTLDEMFAWNLGAHVMGMSIIIISSSHIEPIIDAYPTEGYQFLMQNCKSRCHELFGSF